MNKIGEILLGQNSGEPKKFLSSWGGGGIFFRNSKFGENTHLGNDVRNKHTKFEQDRRIFTWSKFGGTQKISKFMGGGGIFFFFEIQNSEKLPAWRMF